MSMDTAGFVPGLAGIPAVRSGVSFIDGARGLLSYRGIPVEELAGSSTFEETAYLLIYGDLPSAQELSSWSRALASRRRLDPREIDVVRSFPLEAHPMQALQAGAAMLGMLQPVKGPASVYVGEPAGWRPGSARDEAIMGLIAKLPTLVASFHRLRRRGDPIEPREDLSAGSNFLWMLNGAEPDPLASRVMDVCLILHAEHTINASTFGALVTASTLADPHSVVSSAVGSLAGELHGGANERVLAMLREIGAADRARPWVERMIESRGKIMGVGHRVYKTKDPRAIILQSLANRLFDRLGSTELYGIALEVERVVDEHLSGKGVCPNVDFYSGIVYDRMGITSDLFTPIFAVSRVAGWLAHWVEQISDNRLFRPTQVYVGERTRSYVPVAERAGR